MINLFGAALVPILIGTISDSYSLDIAMYILPILAIAAAFVFYKGAKYYVNDQNSVR